MATGADVTGNCVGGLLVGGAVGAGIGAGVSTGAKQLAGGLADKAQMLWAMKSEYALIRVNPLGKLEMQLPSNSLTIPKDTIPTSSPPLYRGPPESPEHVVESYEDAHSTTSLSIMLPALWA